MYSVRGKTLKLQHYPRKKPNRPLYFTGLEAMYHLATTNKPPNKVALLGVRLLFDEVIYTPFTMAGEADG